MNRDEKPVLDYESPSNLLKFNTKTANILNTQATTLNSSRKIDNNENDVVDGPSMFLRTPKEKKS